MSKEVPKTQDGNGVPTWGIWGVLWIGIGGALLVRMGYDLGIEQSRKILKRHDKDVRRMDKREKQIYKEQRKKEQEEKRGNEVHNRWWFGIKKP